MTPRLRRLLRAKKRVVEVYRGIPILVGRPLGYLYGEMWRMPVRSVGEARARIDRIVGGRIPTGERLAAERAEALRG
jgi:hypothetical protein